MAETPTIPFGKSPEEVAYRLMQDIANIESKVLGPEPAGRFTPADRKWLLDTYAECLEAVKSGRDWRRYPGEHRR